MIRVLIVDDHHGVRTATRLILGFEADLQVVGDAANGLAGLRLARELRPDIMVLDLSMPGMDGFDVLRQLAAMKSDIRVVILSGDTAMRSAALACGAAHFVAKGCAGAELVGAVRQAYESRKRPVSTLAISAPLPRAI